MAFKTAILIFVLGAVPCALAQNPFPITGVPVSKGTNGVPLRRNINDLYTAGGAQWDLYIRALSAMQQVKYTEPLSYFQIEGIHGRPFIEWNNAGPPSFNGWGGYCPHGEELFLSWHRPYVLLFEQLLVTHAKEIAATYPQQHRQQYMQAAEQLRAPFWDWAANTAVPEATVPTTLEVNFPNGQNLQKRAISNPLYTYKIPQEVLNGQYGPFDPTGRTQVLRCPSPQRYPETANNALAGRPYKQWVYDTFTRAQNFSNFALTGGLSVSLELIHNSIHMDATCNQQFSNPELSGFDPLFMLHHSNVDRLWAYWQAIKPDQDIFHDSYRGQSRFASAAGTTITSKSPLQPFFGANKVAHTTESVRSIKNFGYSYVGLEYWTKSPTQMQQDATRLINELYSSSSTNSKRAAARAETGQINRYFARVSLDRSDVERPCDIAVFLNGTWAGGFSLMALPASGKISAGLSLDKVVHERNGFSAMAMDSAMSSMSQSIEVKVLQRGGKIVSNVPGLKVVLENVIVTPPSADDQFPTYSDSTLRTLDMGGKARRGYI